jgi:hypothetical protein
MANLMRSKSEPAFAAVRRFLIHGPRLAALLAPLVGMTVASAAEPRTAVTLPVPLASYGDSATAGLGDTLLARIHAAPFNLVATSIFLLAICHTFFASKFRHWAHLVEERHAARLARHPAAGRPAEGGDSPVAKPISFVGQVLHLFGEVEAVFGIWAVVLAAAMGCAFGWDTVRNYFGHRVDFTEPMFVFVIMAVAGTRPILRCAEQGLRAVARIGRATPGAWWLSILIVAPLLGSFVTEPAAMAIAALLLARQFYALGPSPRLAHATLGLLFVNVSVGGTLTHFAAPPVLMVAAPWQWDTSFMFLHFGWKAALAIVLSTTVYAAVFRRELTALATAARAGPTRTGAMAAHAEAPIPVGITLVQLLFLAFTVVVAHAPSLFLGGFLCFLAFSQATAAHQGRLELRAPLLVGFFLAGLVIHGGLQAWWIEPVLRRLDAVPLFLGATVLTAFNDNAAITYLATQVPGLTDPLKYAVVAGAVTGGGLTVIANAPNPAGQSILQRFFPDGVSPLGLLLGAVPPTLITAGCFLFL